MEKEKVALNFNNGKIAPVSDWEVINIDRKQKMGERPEGQESMVSWKIEKLNGKDNKNTHAPKFTIKQAWDTYMSMASQMKSSVYHWEVISIDRKPQKQIKEKLPRRRWQKIDRKTNKEAYKDIPRPRFSFRQAWDSYRTCAIQHVSTILAKIKDTLIALR